MAQSAFAVTSTPQAHLLSPLPALSTVQQEKPRHCHGRKASKPCRALPKASVKIIRKPASKRRKPASKKKKPTSQKRQRSVRNSGNARLIRQGPAPAYGAHGSLEGAANPSRPMRERKPNRQWLVSHPLSCFMISIPCEGRSSVKARKFKSSVNQANLKCKNCFPHAASSWMSDVSIAVEMHSWVL